MDGTEKSFIGPKVQWRNVYKTPGVQLEGEKRKRSDYKARYLTIQGYVFLMASVLLLVFMGMIGFFAGAR